ncbi:hypothetical protein TNCV_1629601 [Trichonephila clavipes]|uniref:Uncharacterized protein n=1 Tax=Trichonephila clavipes TaxID=2585209 RepID=A0A8X6WAH2_TRICX|nr:hypothetical protein TNCV_1629601 [Trichonephila clavipes]
MVSRQNRLVLAKDGCEENAIWWIFSPLDVREEKGGQHQTVQESAQSVSHQGVKEESVVYFERKNPFGDSVPPRRQK